MIPEDVADFLENALDAMHWVGPDGTILWANAAELDMLGYGREEYVGQPISAFHCEREAIDDILARLLRNEKIREYPARLRRKDGSVRDVLITSSVLWRDGEFVHTRCITRDVTEQKRLLAEHQRILDHVRTEHALTRLLSDARPFAEIAPELLRTIGEATGWSVGVLWFVDGPARVLRAVDSWHRADCAAAVFLDDTRQRAFRKGTGLPGRVWESAHAIWLDDVVHAGNFPRADAAERAGLHGAVCFPIRLRGDVAGVVEFLRSELQAPNGEMLQLFEEVGYQIGHYIERRQSDEVRDRLAAIVDSSDDAIVSKTLDGVITSWNRGAEKIFGYTSEEAVGRHITLIIPKERHSEEDDVLSRIRRGIKVDHYETVRQAKDGRLVDISLTVSPVRDSDGRIIGASKVARDVSVWKRAEQVLREREQQAQAEVRARDDFLSIAAHELRNPLNALQLQLVSMHRAALETPEGVPPEWLAERLGQANDDVGTLVRLVHNLLDVVRISAGRLDLEPEDLDYSSVVRTVLRRFGQQLDGAPLSVDAPELRGRSDRLRLEQVVSNLVSNALKYGAGRPIEIALQGDTNTVSLSVRDHGIGIDPAKQEMIFDRFARAVPRRQHGGFGLGLWIARETVHAMGGGISVTSVPGRGSTFVVTLPRVLAPQQVSYAVS